MQRRLCWQLGLAGALGGTGLAWGQAGLASPQFERRPLRFPQDHGAHTHSRTEWWYLTGALQGASGGLWGFQITFFRSRLPLALQQPQHPSGLAARHLVFAHAALSEVGSGRHVHAERLGRWNGHTQGPVVSVSADDTGLRLQGWALQRVAGPAAAPATYRGQWADAEQGAGLQFEALTTQPLLLQGDGGWSRKGPQAQHASFYYSQPQLQVQAELTWQGRRQAVRGTAWLDHEWSESLLDPQAVGWDWMGMNLHDGSALTAFQLRRANGQPLWAGGSLRRPGGQPQAFAANAVQWRPQSTWTSPRTRAVYPVSWQVDTPAGRHRIVTPVPDQEMAGALTGTVYWEGLSELHDARGTPVGRGYLEMTGYAGPLRW